MDMEVGYRLARRLANVDSDIETLGLMTFKDHVPGWVQRGQEGLALTPSRRKPVAHVTAGHQERMTGRDGMGVPEDKHSVAFKSDAVRIRGAEWAGVGHGM